MTVSEQQFLKLKETLTYVSEHSPYYKNLFHKNALSINEILSASDFEKIPFTTKKDLQDNPLEFICVNKNQLIDYVATSGTSGKPVTLALNENDLERLALNECQSFQTAGLKSGDLIQLMTTLDRRFMAGMAYFLGARKLGIGIIRTGNGLPGLQWDTILDLKPNVIICVPSFILKLIEYAEQTGIDYKNSSIKKAICIGESIRQQDFTLNALGTKIHSKWDIELYSTYASSEMASAFTECEYKMGGHLQEDLVYIELVNEDGNAVKDGEAGELVITTLGIEAMPLIRFKTGDVCIAHTLPCACGRKSLRLGPVLGRKNQMIKYKGTSVYPAAIFNILESFEEISFYQVEINSSEISTDDIQIFISTFRDQANQINLTQIKEAFQNKLRVAPGLHLTSEKNMQERIFPENSRKALKFLDKRN